MEILEYSIQLAMLNQLLGKNLISQQEYEKIKCKLMQDYGVVSNITA